MTTVMIVGGRADDAFYEMAHVWSVRPYRSRRFLRMTGANSIPTHRTTTSIPIHLLPTRLCMGISLNWISSTLKNESHRCLSGGSNCTSSGSTQLMHRGFSLIQQMQFSQQAQGQHAGQSDSLVLSELYGESKSNVMSPQIRHGISHISWHGPHWRQYEDLGSNCSS